MKVLSLVKLIACIMVSLGIMLLAACGGVTVTPNGDGGVTVTPNENEGGNNAGGSSTPDTGNKDENVIHSHTYKLDTSTTGYSCTEGGVRTWKCACGESFNETIEAPGHNIRTYEGKTATCETDGYEPYEKCINGNCDYTTYKVIPALGHNLQYYADVQPTCTTAGVTDKAVCNRDGCNYSTETKVPALGHLRQTIEGKAATCTQSGYYTYEICTRAGCSGEGISKPVTIDALGHDNLSYEGKEPTCTAPGWYAYTVCQRCSYSTYTQRPATGHTYVNGYCSVCNHGDPGLHSHVWNSGEVITSATCTSAGEMKYTCTDSHCGDTKTEVIPTLGHDNKSYSAKSATCTAEGWYAYTECQRCGYSTKTIIPMINHSYTGVITTQPTCTMPGVRTYTCVCGKSYTAEIEKLGHDWGNWYITKDATCETNGQEQRVCFNDSNHVDIGTIPKIGHSWGDWTVISNPSCVTKGQEKRVCDNNSTHAEIREIPTVDHNVNASTGICSVCEKPIKERLDTPQNITEKDSVIYWNTVEGADHYEVVVDGSVIEVTSTKFDLEDYYGTNYELQIKIRAIAPADSGVINSAYYEYVFDIPTEPIADYDGLGEAVNLLTGGYTETNNRHISIFDEALFNRLRVEEDEERNSFSVVRYAESLHGYVDKLSTSISTKVDMKISADFMKIVNATAGYSFGIDESYDKKTQSETKAVFYDMDYYYTSKRAGIYGSNDLSILSDALSEEFLSNAKKLQNGELSPETFINLYGTHIITSGVYGGSFNLHYEMISTTKNIEETFKVGSQLEISSQVGAAIKGLDLKQTVDTKIETNDEAFKTNTSSDVQSKFTLVTKGGNITGKVCESLADFSAVCEAWAEDLKAGEDYVLIDVEDGSLVFIWELLNDAEYAGAKNLLYNYFYSTCDEQYYALKDKISSFYKDSYIFDETDGTLVIDFSNLQSHSATSLSGVNYDMENGTEVFNGDEGRFTVSPKFNGKEVNKIIFKGGYRTEDESGDPYEGKFTPFTIEFSENWTRDIVIEFENFAYEAPAGYAGLDFSEVKSENITIIVTGNVYIKGGNGGSNGQAGLAGIDSTGKNLVIEGEGSLEVVGGNGVSGTNYGEAGSEGGIGIIVLNAIFESSTNITVIGGNGGNGYKGADSTVKGSNGADRTVIGGNVGHGGKGGTGGTGGAGGNGGDAMIGTIYVECVNCTLIGGNGGNGAKGGKGGTGGTGGDNTAWGGSTGNGGKGGTGGTGGDAGHGGLNNQLVYIASENSTVSVVSGKNGIVGIGGDGGSGGKPGTANPSCGGGGVYGATGDTGNSGIVKVD